MQGLVRVLVAGEIVVAKYGDLIDDVLDVPLFCPRCGRTAGLTLVADGREAHLECVEGHVWTDPEVAACGVRQLLHLSAQGAPPRFPGAAVRIDMLPRISEDRTLYPPSPDVPGRLLRWEGRVLTATGTPPLTDCLHWARRLCAWALPSDGELYERLYPPAGGNALDAHMAVVLVALALYATAAAADLARVEQVVPDRAAEPLAGAELRWLRPPGAGGLGGRLRVTDVHRLATAAPETYQRWRTAARLVLAANTDDRPAVPLADRSGRLPAVAEDMAWYAPVGRPDVGRTGDGPFGAEWGRP
ncbi:hypothetical protein [Streptomyces sp. Ag109_O5-10]|uniref:hypothetical protein n=1 Tax=Streptomyces sp. Ag109_O5-10 TaxID=1855349 RepID=UPI0008956658|nr:hypothetical protein [Streptomyces sp. Ag109_O5-10]SEF15439.1 hypothetical protein SAMN05216533_7400 [Streptomyces sp. Ag109_O5-10]